MSEDARSKSQQFECAEDLGSNTSTGETIGDVIASRLSRRDLVVGLLAVSTVAATFPADAQSAARKGKTTPSFDFKEVAAGSDDKIHVAEGHDANVLIRWGDKVLADAPDFDPQRQSPAAQARQFGYNNDFLGYVPLMGSSQRGLLVVNHEYTNEELMFPGIGRQDNSKFAKMTKELVDIEMMAHGGSVIEVRKRNGKWGVVEKSAYNRRITASTETRVSGPAAGHVLMRTNADPTGTRVLGMLNNCAGGMTPWGTWLTCEENFNGYFWGSASGHPNEAALKRYGVPSNWYNWGQHYDRFDISKEPNEANRFGWIVEIDPMDPRSIPVKRTAMGRFKHEGAGGIVNRDGRYVVYSGDDERFDYVYKFVTEGRVDRRNRAANRELLDSGTLYVAKYNADGTGEWLPLVHGQGKLTAGNGFRDQGEVLINSRLAGDALGATKMDRPEDIDVNPRNNKVYLLLTNNRSRTAAQVDAANPRANNLYGHIIEMMPDGGDHASTRFRWEILVKCGDHTDAKVGASFNPATTKNGWFGMPDNSMVDPRGRLWIATDGNSPQATGRADGVWAIETEGPARGTAKHFFRCPNGAELCGPCMTPDMTTMFVAIQHPGESEDPKVLATFEKPSTRWPDFKPDMPPRPAIVAITRRGGGRIA
jgi:secreted PhoX family phosphatase